MKKSKNKKSFKSLVSGGVGAKREHTIVLNKNGAAYYCGVMAPSSTIALFSLKKKETEVKVKKEPEELKKFTVKEQASIKAATSKALAALSLLPPSPFVNIVPSMGLSKFSPIGLVNYCGDKFIRIDAVAVWAGANPTLTSVKLINDALLPLAAIGRKMSEPDRIQMDTYVLQLKNNFTQLILSIANLCNGDANLFAISGVAMKKKAVRNYKRLKAPTVKLNTHKGANTIGCSCKPIKYATSYSIAYGVGDDVSKYKVQTGNSNQLVVDLVAGELVNFIMWANTGKQAGYPSAPQAVYVPYS